MQSTMTTSTTSDTRAVRWMREPMRVRNTRAMLEMVVLSQVPGGFQGKTAQAGLDPAPRKPEPGPAVSALSTVMLGGMQAWRRTLHPRVYPQSALRVLGESNGVPGHVHDKCEVEGNAKHGSKVGADRLSERTIHSRITAAHAKHAAISTIADQCAQRARREQAEKEAACDDAERDPHSHLTHNKSEAQEYNHAKDGGRAGSEDAQERTESVAVIGERAHGAPAAAAATSAAPFARALL